MEFNLEFFATVGHLMTGFGTIILAVLLYRTLQHLEATSQLAIIQSEYKFRPWVGPTGAIRELSSDQTKKQIEITVKNFGDLPASNVTAFNIIKSTIMTKDEIRTDSKNKINLGPLLPNMEKRFWFYIDKEVIDGALQANTPIYSGIIFEYPLAVGKSEYGLISEINPRTLEFVHKDMWVQSPPIK